MSIAKQVVIPSLAVRPYFDKKNQPSYYEVSGTTYSRLSIPQLMQPRGLYNKELQSLRTHLPNGAYIAGSFVASVFNKNHPPTDIDIFFNSSQAFVDTYDMLVNPPDEESAWALQGYKTNTPPEDIITRSQTIRVVNFTNEDPAKLPIQLIKMAWYDNAEAVVDSFDFTVTQFAVDKDYLVVNPVSLIDLQHDQLVVHKFQFPMESLYRLVKYTKKGYKVSPRTLKTLVDYIRSAKELDPPLPFTMY